MSTGGFDLGGHLAGLIVYAMETPEKAPAVGWFHAFMQSDGAPVALSELAATHARLPAGIWKGDESPRPLMTALPIFGIRTPDGELLTEPIELARVDWNATDHHLTLFDGYADRVDFLKGRSTAYLAVLSDWFDPGADREVPLARLCHQYAALFNARLYLEAYKLLEIRWMSEEPPAKGLLQGLMQVAVGLYQIETGRYAIDQLEEGYYHIRENAGAFPAPTLPRFLKRLERAIGALKGSGPERFQSFDLEVFPRLWMKSPWKIMFGLGG
ncbi:MAG: DUF309 domain-containing protein [Leptospirillia bacterium]